jgi:hypothetical protein
MAAAQQAATIVMTRLTDRSMIPPLSLKAGILHEFLNTG